MNLETVKPVVDAVLYEGYILYPYRASSAKNRQRWTFGGIYPRIYSDATGDAEPWRMQTQCLLEGDGSTRLEVRVRFLQPVAREVGELSEPAQAWNGPEPRYRPVATLTVGETPYRSWQEALERDVAAADCSLADLLGDGRVTEFDFEAAREFEPLRADDGVIAGVLVRNRTALSGRVTVRAEAVADAAFRITVRIENETAMDPAGVQTRDEASLCSFASTHTVLGASGGAFVSLTDPPDYLQAAADACHNTGAWPVLVGEPGARDLVLSSPIILYDYPEIAPESPGDLFDGTEIDEILSLNILAMTDEEKREMAATDPRAAMLLERTEALNGDDFMRLHGVLRQPRPVDGPPVPASTRKNRADAAPRLAWLADGATRLRVGDPVVLRPKRGGDVMDLVLDGKRAVIESIERDFEDRVHVAVAVDDDPGREWALQRMPGHRFFFSPEEIEPLERENARERRT